MTYTGTVVEESLKDNRFINELNVQGVRISSAESPGDRWHLYKISIEKAQISNLAQELKPDKWYMHFWHDDHVIAVFPNKIFHFLYSDQSTWSEAIEHGKSLGISEEQLDFVIE